MTREETIATLVRHGFVTERNAASHIRFDTTPMLSGTEVARRLAAMERVVEAARKWKQAPHDLYALREAVSGIDTALAAYESEVGK